MTWPRIRIAFALIGMGVTLLFIGEHVLNLLAWLASMAEEGKEMLPK